MQRLGHVLGRGVPQAAPPERAVAVLPSAVGVLDALGFGDGEVRDSLPGRGESQFGRIGEIADDGDRCHVFLPFDDFLA